MISGRGMSKSSDPEEFFSTFVIWGSYLRGEISSFVLAVFWWSRGILSHYLYSWWSRGVLSVMWWIRGVGCPCGDLGAVFLDMCIGFIGGAGYWLIRGIIGIIGDLGLVVGPRWWSRGVFEECVESGVKTNILWWFRIYPFSIINRNS